MLVGIVLLCYGISSIIVSKTINDFQSLAKIIITFVIGFFMIVVSIIHIQKRTLELLVEESDTRKEKNNINSLIFNKKVYNQGPKIVVIGGGSGLNTVLRGLKTIQIISQQLLQFQTMAKHLQIQERHFKFCQ